MRVSIDSPRPKVKLIASSGADYAFWIYRNIAINHWRTDITLGAVGKLTELTAERQIEWPEGVTSLHWVDAGVPLPSAEVRAGLSEIMIRYSGHVRSVCAVIESEGFFASALRSALTGIVLLAPTKVPVRVFGKLADLSRWLPAVHQRGTGVTVTTEELVTNIREAIGRPLL